MKRIAIAIASVAMMLMGTQSFAQGKYGADSAECIQYLSYYQEYYKQKNYDEAMPNWRTAMKLCPPTASQNLLLHGATLVKNAMSKTRDAAERQGLVDTLMNIYDLRVQYYPSTAVTARNNKALDMSNYIKDDQVLYDSYSEIIAANGVNTNARILIFHMNAAIALYEAGKLSTEDILSIYQADIETLDKLAAKTDAERQQNAQIKTDLETLFIASKVASCDKLIELFTPRYQSNPNDLELVTNIAKMMSVTEGCQSNDLYLNAVTSMYKLDPSYSSAYFLYRLNSSRGNVQDAVKYIEEAIESDESDEKTDAEYLYELAAFAYKNGLNAKAADAANRARDLDPSLSGKVYFLLGTIWGSLRCGGNEIESKAPFWVAVDYLQRARTADPTLAEEAGRMIGQFSQYYPQTADAFMYDLTDGQSYTVSCGGMRATTTVRTRK